jgi:hypothetical protein
MSADPAPAAVPACDHVPSRVRTLLGWPFTWIDGVILLVWVTLLSFIVTGWIAPSIWGGVSRPDPLLSISLLILCAFAWGQIRSSSSTEGQASLNDLTGSLLFFLTGCFFTYIMLQTMSGRSTSILSNIPTEGPTVVRVEKKPGEQILRINRTKGVKIQLEMKDPDPTINPAPTQIEFPVQADWHGKVWYTERDKDSGAASF